MELAHRVPGIDLLFCGHIHVGYEKPWEDPVNHTLCFQTYGRGSGIGRVNIYIDRGTKTVIGYDYEGTDGSLLTLFEDEFLPDPVIGAEIQSVLVLVEVGMDEVIGESEVAITRSGAGESPMGNLVCDAVRERFVADFAFSNFGGIRDDIGAGSITPRNVFKVLPFGNQLVVARMNGGFLKRVVEQRLEGERRGLLISSGKIIYDRSRPDGDRTVRFEIGGAPLDPNWVNRAVYSE